MTRRRLTIAIDCDDVLIPTAQSIVSNYNDRFGTKLGLEHMYTPIALDIWGTKSGDEAIERVNEFLRSEKHAAISPFTDAITAIRRLARVHNLHLVTGRASFLQEVTKRTLDAHFPDCFQGIEHTNYITTSTDLSVKRTKGQVCKEIGADLLVDDHIAHGHDVVEAGLGQVIIFGNYPWNQGDLPKGMVRCEDWNAVQKEITQYAAQ